MKKNRTIDDISENGPFKFFEHQISYLKKFCDWTTFKVVSDIPTLNGITIRLKKGEKSYFYSADNINIPKDTEPVIFQNIRYGFKAPFKLVNENTELEIPQGVNIHNMAFKETDSHFGNINNLNTKNFYNAEKFYRVIIPIEYQNHNDITYYFKTNSVKIDNWSKYTGLLNINNYDIFEYHFENVDYLIIEINKKIEFENFYNDITIILYCFALISGNLYRDEYYFFGSLMSTFQDIDGFAFKEQENSILGDSTVIPYKFISILNNIHKFEETRISSNIFNQIVEKSLNKPELYRCIKLLTEAACLPLEIKTSIYSVCLETIRNIIQEKNEEKLNPFKIKADCKIFIKQCKKILNQIPDASFNNKDTIIKRIENVNQLGNTESFTAMFSMLGIYLTEDDINCINKRNDFLHGRLPFEDRTELRYISDKLFQLCEYAILKYCDYSGIVLNQANLTLALNKSSMQRDSFILRRI